MLEQVTRDDWMVREILSTAKQLFNQHGLKKTTMEDIATAMGKGKSTLYYYFPSKVEIFEAVVEEELVNMLRALKKAIECAPTAKEKLKAYSRVRLSITEKFRNLSAVVYENVMNHLEMVVRLKQKHDILQIDLIQNILHNGMQSKEFKQMSENQIQLFSKSFVAAFRGLELWLHDTSTMVSKNSSTDVLIEMLVDGLKK